MSPARIGAVVGALLFFGCVATLHAAPVPGVTEDVPAEAFAGEPFCYTATLTNTNEPGYAPYLRLFVADGLSLDSATFLDSSVARTDVGTFATAPSNQLQDPLIDTDVTGRAGSDFIVLDLPVGSVTAGSPPLEVEVCATIDSSAAIGTPLPISLTPVYELGDTATGDNGPIVGDKVDTSVTPTLYHLSKENTAPESERPPGAGFPYDYRLVVDVANGKTVENLVANDSLPPDFQFDGPVDITGGSVCSVDTQPSSSSPGGQLQVSCDSVTGTAQDDDLTIAYTGHVVDTLEENVCTNKALDNTATLDGEYPAGTALPQVSTDDRVTAKHVAVQTTAAPEVVTPGDSVAVTSNFQVTEFGDADTLVIEVAVPDGLKFTGHDALSVGGSSVSITPTVTTNPGDNTVTYDIGAKTGTLTAGTTGTVTFDAVVEQSYANGKPVLAFDPFDLGTTAPYSLSQGATGCSDGSSAAILVENVAVTKEVVNPQPEYVPGDTVTYRLSLEVPSGDTDNIAFEDFFPLPVHDVGSLNTAFGNDVTRASIDTAGLTPDSISVDSATNSLRIEWPDLSSSAGQTIAVDVAIVVEDDPFADSLDLTNLLQVDVNNTRVEAGGDIKAGAFTVRAPELAITKGVSASDNSNSTVNPPASTKPVDGDLSGVDAGDTVTFVTTVENTGGAPAYDVTIADTSPSQLGSCSLSSVQNGSGSALGYTGDFFNSAVVLDSELAAGAKAVVTATCDIANTVNPTETFDNTADVQWRAGSGATPFAPKSDTANVTIAEPALQKAIDTIAPGPNAPDFTVGDVVTYDITVTLPEGTTNGLTLTDTLPDGLVFNSGTVSVDSTGHDGSGTGPPAVSGAGTAASPLKINFGTVTTTADADSNPANNQRLVVTLAATVHDDAANSALSSAQGKSNTVELAYDGGPSQNASDNGQFTEPNLQVAKSMAPANPDAGDTITITLEVENTGTAPAYDIAVTDKLNDAGGDLFDLTAGATDTTGSGASADFNFDFTSPTVTYTSAGGYALAAAESVTLSFTGTANDGVISGSSYSNDASVTGDGQNGDPPSGIQRPTDDGDNAAVAIQSTAVTKTLAATTEAWTSGNSVAIGEVLTYEFAVDVPEGVVQKHSGKAIITDSLPEGLQFQAGTATIRTNGVDESLEGSFYGPLPAATTTITTGSGDLSVTGDAANGGQTLAFNLGDLTNYDYNNVGDGDTEQIIVRFDALVLNDAVNNRGDDKQNQAALNYRNRAGTDQSATDTHTATVVEPNLSVSKSADPATVEGNDTVTFEVVVANPVGDDVTRAWDIALTDVLPPRYDANYTLTSAVLSRDSTDVAACAGFGSGANANVLSLDMTCFGEAERYLAPGETITLTYAADVAGNIGFEEAVINTVSVTGTSLAGGSGDYDAPGNGGTSTGERTGSGSGTNDISAMANATVAGKVPTITKSGGAGLAVGDTTTMTLEVDVPVGETQDFEVSDDLPAGLTYTGDSITINLPSSGFSATGTPSTMPGEGTDPLQFDFGDIANTSGGAQSITISYEARVANVAANQGGDTLTNTASVTYLGQSDSVQDTADVMVLEPNLEIGKTITAGGAGSDAGDTVSYQVAVTNNGDSTAYQVDLRDVLPPELLGAPDGSGSAADYFLNVSVDNDGGAVTTSGGGSGLAATDAQFPNSGIPGDTLTWPAFDIPAGTTLTITYDAVIDNSAVAGSTLENTASADYSSLAGNLDDERTNADNGDDDDDSDLDNYGESTASSFTVDSALNVQKSLNPKHADNDFTIGDLVTFDVRVDMVEGTVEDVRVSDTLPSELTFVGPARIVAEDNISYAGSPDLTDLDWSLGNVTNASDGVATNDYFVIEFDARIADVPANADGTTLDNVAEVFTSGNSAGTDDAVVDITEPLLVVEKTASDTTPSLGDAVIFTVTVSHDGDSTADAHDVQVTDVLPDGLTYAAGSHYGDGTVDTSDPARPVFELGTITQADASKSFTFEASVGAGATVGADMTNRVNLAYDGQPNDPDAQRDYTGSGEETVTPDADALIDAVKTVSLAVDDDGDGVVDPGDTLAYSVTLTNDGPDVTGVVFTDPLPNNVAYVANSLQSDRGTVDDSGDPLRVAVGDLASGETANVSFRVIVAAGTSEGTVIRNQGSVDSDQSVPEPTDEDGVDSNGDQPTDAPVGGGGDSPDLYTVKSVQWHGDADDSDDITAGDTMRYRLVLENTSEVALTGVTLADAIPNGLSFVAGSEAITGAGNTVTVTSGDVSAMIPELTAGDTATVRFDVTIDPFSPATRSYVNQAATDSEQTPPGQSDGNGFPGDGNQPTSFDAVSSGPGTPALDLEKRVALAADNDADGVISPGDALRYRMTLANSGSGKATNVRLSDAIPNDTSVVPGSVSTSRGIVVSDDPVAINIGNLAAGSRVTVAFRVTVSATASDGTIISNQAKASSNELPDEPSDDNGSDGDGKNPNRTPVSDDPDGGGGTPAGEPGLAKNLHASSETTSVGTAAVIGEVLTYRVVVAVPPGQLDSVVIVDQLPAGLAYRPGSARLSRTFDTGLQSANDPGGINAAASGDWATLNDGADIQVSGGNLTLDLGTVINSDSDADTERYVLELRALVENVTANQAGSQRNNGATLTYDNALNQSEEIGPETAAVTLTEPNLAVTKAVSPATLSASGGSVTFTLEVTNGAGDQTAKAHDVRIVDDPPPAFSAITVDSVTSSGGVTGVSDNSSGTTVDIAVDTFPPDGELLIEVTATAVSGDLSGVDALLNTVRVTSTSLPGENGSSAPGDPGDADGERTGDDGSGGVNDLATSDTAEVPVVGAIGDRVWHDSNADGVQDAGEPGIAGVTVRLLDGAGSAVASTMTDGAGHYRFDEVVAGNYQVAFAAPTGFALTTPDQGAGPLSDALDSDAAVSDGRTAGFTLASGEVREDLDAGLTYEDADKLAYIGDRVWYDGNRNGRQDAGESGVAGVTVELFDSAGNLVATEVTDGGGGYGFSGLPAGNYEVGFEAPDGYAFSGAGQAPEAVDSDANPGDGRTGVFDLVAGENKSTVDAGLSQPGVAPASIGDRAWLDVNDDGIQDSGEPGQAGVTVRLFDAADPATPIATAVTDNDGAYAFTGLPAGDYRVVFERPDGLAFGVRNAGGDAVDSDVDPGTGRTASRTLAAGVQLWDVDAALVTGSALPNGPISIGDTVWRDVDGNARPDSGEGLPDVAVILYDSRGNPVQRTSTDADGTYGFSGLVPGDYRVQVDRSTLPAGAYQIVDPDETSGECATCDSAGDLASLSESTDTVDFGYRVAATVSITKSNGQQRVRIGETLTYDITVTNESAEVAVEGARVTDTERPGVTFLGLSCAGTAGAACTGAVDLATLQGDGVRVDLPAGASVTLALEAQIDDAAAGEVANEATVTMPPELTNEGPKSDADVDPVLFDPPSGTKTVSGDGRPLIEWQMVWINGSNTAAVDAMVTDSVDARVDYEPGSLTCQARGSSTVTECVYDTTSREIRYVGSIGPDQGASNAAEADNEVIITFQVAVPGTVQSLGNQACVRIDDDGDGSIDPGVAACTDDSTGGGGSGTPPGSEDPTPWERPAENVPATGPWALLLLFVVFMWVVGRRTAGAAPFRG